MSGRALVGGGNGGKVVLTRHASDLGINAVDNFLPSLSPSRGARGRSWHFRQLLAQWASECAHFADIVEVKEAAAEVFNQPSAMRIVEWNWRFQKDRDRAGLTCREMALHGIQPNNARAAIGKFRCSSKAGTYRGTKQS